MRRLITVVLITFALGAIANAQLPGGNIFVGYSYLAADTNTSGHANLNGWNGSLEGKVFPFIGIVADLSGHYGSERFPALCGVTSCSVNAKVHSALFGPRVSFTVGHFTPFAHVLVGVSHISADLSGSSASDSDTSFSEAFGGGIDYRLIKPIDWRIQADMLQTRFFSNTQDNFRLSTGLVLRF